MCYISEQVYLPDSWTLGMEKQVISNQVQFLKFNHLSKSLLVRNLLYTSILKSMRT